MASTEPETAPVDERSARKRRKIRKGTTSCWECKRRKVRCQFASQSHEICEGCQRRGTACLTQDYDNVGNDEITVDKHKDTEEKLKRAEELLEVFTKVASRLTPAVEHQSLESRAASPPGIQGESHGRQHHLSNSVSPSAASSTRIQVFDSLLVDEGVCLPDDAVHGVSATTSYRHIDLGQQLYATLPPQSDAELIISSGNTAAFLQFFTLPYRTLFSGNLRSASSLSTFPSPASHPVLLARTLLYLANGLQNLHPSTSKARQLRLGRPATELMKEYLEAASLVTSNDQLLNSLEGLECLLLEAAYHTNAGDLRRAWLVIKRAVAHAQLIGLHRGHPANPVVLDPETQTSPSIMWHRIVSEDRYLALMLGLPPDTSARAVPANMSLAAGECPSEYLERIHAQAMGLIAARNDEDDASGDILATQEIDQMLQQAARSMPDNWWLLPTAKRRSESSNIGNVESLENVLRILLQITHFNLLVLLHLPQMLRRVSVHSQSYSKDACVNASRELLGRYVKFRCMNQISFCCTGIDFAAFTACLALLLAHLERTCRGSDVADFLGHQRLSDRATIEEVVDLMLEVNGSSCDELLAQTAFILRSFLDIEGDAAADVTASAGQTVNSEGYESQLGKRCLRLNIPFFGALVITHRGIHQDSANLSAVNSTSRTDCHRIVHDPQTQRDQSWDTTFNTFPHNILSSEQISQLTAYDTNLRDEAEDLALQTDHGTLFNQLPCVGDGIIEGTTSGMSWGVDEFTVRF